MSELPKLRKGASWVVDRVHEALKVNRAEELVSRLQDDSGALPLRMSASGQCVRALWMERQALLSVSHEAIDVDLRVIPDHEPRMLMLFELGHKIEEVVINLLEDAGFQVSNEQAEVSELGGLWLGHIDGEILLHEGTQKECRALLEVKSANKRRFDELEEVGYEAWNEGYAAQVHAYMGGRKLTQALVVVYCKDDSRLYAERIDFNPDAFKGLWQKAQTVISAEEIPERPTPAKSQFCKFCKYCEWGEQCWSPMPGESFDA
jgi:hypothetical protein